MARAVALVSLPDTLLSLQPDTRTVCCSQDLDNHKLRSPMRATSAMRSLRVRQLEVPLSVTKLARYQGKEGSSLLLRRKFHHSEAEGWSKLSREAEFSAGLWSRMVLGGDCAKAASRLSATDPSLQGIADDQCRARDYMLARMRADSRIAGWKKVVPIDKPAPFRSARKSVRTLSCTAGDAIVAEPSSVRRLSKKESVVDERLVAIRKAFQMAGDAGIDAYVIPSEDPHQSEFIADCYQRRAFISGFTGSSGTAAVTKVHAALWTDGRYFLQAEKQLRPGWILMRQGTAGVPSIGEWLLEVLPKGSRVGIDPFLFSVDAADELRNTLRRGDHKLLLLYDGNLVDKVWGEERPSPPAAPIRLHDIKYAGIDVQTKISRIRDDLSSAGATALVVSMLDDIAWVLNLRGGDIPHSPVTYAYLVIGQKAATLFVDETKVTPEVAAHLREASVTVQPYTALVSSIQRLAEAGAKLWMDPKRLSVAILDAFNEACTSYYERVSYNLQSRGSKGSENEENERYNPKSNCPAPILSSLPLALAKALKNPAELEGMRQAHLRDAAAVVEFWAWIENQIVEEGKTFTEVEVAERLEDYRAKQQGFLDTSFETIAGSGPNGAIVHYRAEPSSCAEVNGQKLFLLDSGAQFVDGTTDITRTVHFGNPSAREKECFTRVLQGHIAVDKAIFPEHTPGFVLDVLARSSLWKIGLDYRHGTGHGVGAALNVHEGPQSISSRFGNLTGLQAGMIVSNEPGYYEDCSFGVRIENLLIVREVDTPNNYGGTTYLGFERLTFVPIQTKLLDLTIMSEEEIDWLNKYHMEIWDKVSPLVDGESRAWLQRNTELISSRIIREDTSKPPR